MDYNELSGRIEALLADLLRRMDQHTEQMDRQNGQIDDVIGILKISDARQTRVEERQEKAEERQDAMLARLEQQGERLKEQGARLDTLLQTQMKMLELMSNNANRTDEMERKFPVITAYEARFQRLEAAVFNKAS